MAILDGKETRELFDRYRIERDLCVSNGERERAIEQSRAAARIRPGTPFMDVDEFGEDAEFEEIERAPAIQPVTVGEAGLAVGAFIGACVAGVFAGAFVVLRAAFAPRPKRQSLPKQPDYFLPTVPGYPKGTYERTVKFEFHEKYTSQ